MFPFRFWHAVEILGGRSRTRTYDPLIKSQLLYHLSYAPILRGSYRGAVKPRKRRERAGY